MAESCGKHMLAASGNETFHRAKLKRNSSIELLRIISMFMILAHHFVVHNASAYKALPVGICRFVVQFLFVPGGKIGVVIFFTISAWFFLEHDQTLKGCVRRIWFLEKEVFFYSILLMMLYAIFDKPDFNMKLAAKSLLPLIYGVWWYPTSYAVFLLFLPFLEKGLKALGRRNHLILAMVSLGVYGVLGLFPNAYIASDAGFIYLFVLISAYRWYIEEKQCINLRVMVGSGAILVFLFTGLSMAAKALYNIQIGSSSVITESNRLPAVLIGFGMFLFFERKEFHSAIINTIAKGAFAVYLITDYPASEQFLWRGPLDLYTIGTHPIQLLEAVGILIAMYLACTLVDLIRHALFSVTIDRFWGAWFNALWSRVAQLGNSILVKIK